MGIAICGLVTGKSPEALVITTAVAFVAGAFLTHILGRGHEPEPVVIER